MTKAEDLLMNAIEVQMAKRRQMVANVRQAYESGRITPTTDLRETRRQFSIVRAWIKRLSADLEARRSA